ncbi:MAG TPA: glycosyltransferase [Pyrinomonadaceae bacterium]|jgi:glycosyltransferase involved in cell wall biosynthesis|nr:glycosyltransferase [Pyrinomonadaceae bacterium]
MAGLKVLIANATLATLTGTETYVRDLALGLLRKGHCPIVYAPELGHIADELQRGTVPVVDNLNRVGAVPDVIHGNHNTELITSLLQFENVPAVFYCHSWTDWISAPPAHPRILRYVAVDDTCRDRLVLEHAIPEERVRVQLHAADPERFKAREPLPAKPVRALVFSNNANHWTHLNAVREACRRADIKLDVVGSGINASATNPETLLGDYDLVFAKARCALEALTVGTAVILCDAAGCGPLVTTTDLERLRRLNFGIRTLTEKADANRLLKAIERYDAADAMEVSRRVREASNLENLVDDVINVYREVIAEFRELPVIDTAAENRAVAEYLRWMTLAVRGKQAQFETMLVNSPTLRLRNQLGRVPLMNKVLRPIAQFARRKHENGNG